MKKTVFGLTALAGALAFGGVDNKVITFSTPGPDKYADGSTVRKGEFYALVWTRNGVTEKLALTAEGKVVGSEADYRVLLKAPVATANGHCPFVQFELDEDFYAEKGLANGTLAVYLLDTRKFKADADGVLVKEDGRFVVESCGVEGNPVRGYGDTGATIALSDGGSSAAAPGAVATGSRSKAPTKAHFSKIEVLGDNVYLHVKGASPSMLYGVTSGQRPNALADDGERRYGKPNGEMIIVRQAKADGEFFNLEEK